MKFILIAVFALLTGCASQDYALYVETTAKIDAALSASRSTEVIAKHNADAAKYKALSDIAASGPETAKIAAVMALALGDKAAPALAPEVHKQLQAPPPDRALQWASVLVPSLTQIVGMGYNYRAMETQSNNARDVAVSTNQAFVGMNTGTKDTAAAGYTAISGVVTAGTLANTNVVSEMNKGYTAIAGMIQAPAANVATTTTISGDGVVGAGTMTKSPVTTTTTTSTANPVTTTSTANPVTTTTTSANPTTTTTDNHTTNPTVTVDGKVCSVAPVTGVLACL